MQLAGQVPPHPSGVLAVRHPVQEGVQQAPPLQTWPAPVQLAAHMPPHPSGTLAVRQPEQVGRQQLLPLHTPAQLGAQVPLQPSEVAAVRQAAQVGVQQEVPLQHIEPLQVPAQLAGHVPPQPSGPAMIRQPAQLGVQHAPALQTPLQLGAQVPPQPSEVFAFRQLAQDGRHGPSVGASTPGWGGRVSAVLMTESAGASTGASGGLVKGASFDRRASCSPPPPEPLPSPPSGRVTPGGRRIFSDSSLQCSLVQQSHTGSREVLTSVQMNGFGHWLAAPPGRQRSRPGRGMSGLYVQDAVRPPASAAATSRHR